MCKDERRRCRRLPPSVEAESALVVAPGDDGRELAIAVRAFVDTLPPRQREAVILRKFQELDYEEISTVLGCSPEAARANVYQGLRRIRAHFLESDHR